MASPRLTILRRTEPQPRLPVGTPEEDPHYAIVQRSSDKRYTFGVLYTPDEIDAHGEYASADDLQKAVHDYVMRGDLELRDMHDTSKKIGHVVEIVTWPFEVELELMVPGETDKATNTVTVPPGTVFTGVIWSEDVWPDVKAGKYKGYSLGGKTVRVYDAEDDDALEPMGKAEGEADDDYVRGIQDGFEWMTAKLGDAVSQRKDGEEAPPKVERAQKYVELGGYAMGFSEGCYLAVSIARGSY
jgi:hypothetical protein